MNGNISEEINIRPAMIKDADAVYQLVCILSEAVFDRAEFTAIFSSHLEKQTQRYFVAEIKDGIAGFVSLSMHPLLHHCAMAAEIVELVVHPDHRGGNIGSLLLNAVEGVARENHCAIIELSSNKKRERAHRFYEKSGYSITHYHLTKPL